MLLVLLIACDGADLVGQARARAEAFLAAHPQGTAIVQARVGGDRLAGVVGTRWQGADLAAALAPCGPDTEKDFDAELILEPGRSPWDVDGADLTDCVEERLAAFPFEEPSRRGQRDLVVVRWRPGQVAEPYAEADRVGGVEPAPRGLWSQAPPYWRVSLDGEPLWDEGFDVVDGRLLLPPLRGRKVAEGALDGAEAWARQLTCPEEKPGLVRVALGFRGGDLEVRETLPENECVEEHIRESKRWMRDQRLGTTVLRDAAHAIVILDVPMGAW